MGRSFKLFTVLLVGLAAATAGAKPVKKSDANLVVPEGEYLVKSGRRVHYVRSKYYASNSVSPKRKVKVSRSPKKTVVTKKAVIKSQAGKKIVQSKKRVAPSRKLASKPALKAKAKVGKKKSHAAKAAKVRKHERRTASHPKSRRVPDVRRGTSERDSPFVSRHRVTRQDKTFVMEDPAVKNPLPRPRGGAGGPGLTAGEGALDPNSESAPSEVEEAKSAMNPPPVVGPAPASVAPEAPAADTLEAADSHVAAGAASREPDAFDLHSGADPMRGP